MIQLFNGWRPRLRKLPEQGKCQSCGDKTLLYEYNKAMTCATCLGRDVAGVSRTQILKRNLGNKNEQIRRTGKKRW